MFWKAISADKKEALKALRVHIGFDPEAAKHTEGQFKQQGIQLKPDFSPVKVVKEKDGKLTMTAKNNDDKEITLDGIDYILMATGRKPATQGLGLDKVCWRRLQCITPAQLAIAKREQREEHDVLWQDRLVCIELCLRASCFINYRRKCFSSEVNDAA